MLKAAGTKPHVNQTRNLSLTSPILYQLDHVRSYIRSALTGDVTHSDIAESWKCHSRRHSAVRAEAASVADEYCFSASVFQVEVHTHHPTAPSSTLDEGSGAD